MLGIILIIIGVILCILAFIILIVDSDSMTELSPLILLSIGIALLIIGVVFWNLSNTSTIQTIYNNGVHAVDGGHWDFVGATKYKYFYKCDKCGKVLESWDLLNRAD